MNKNLVHWKKSIKLVNPLSDWSRKKKNENIKYQCQKWKKEYHQRPADTKKTIRVYYEQRVIQEI